MNTSTPAQSREGSQSKLGTAPVFRLIITMSLPSVFSMLIQALYNIVDSIYVSRISESALSAVSLVFPIQMLVTAVGVGTGVGLSSLISRRLGEKRLEEAQLAADHGFLLGICHWIVFLLFGIFGSAWFCGAFSENPELIEPATQYCAIVCIGSLFMLCVTSFEKIMQASGNMIGPMWCMLSGAVTNIILDPILIFGQLGLPAMGVAGAAYATVIGQLVSFVLAVVFMRVKDMPAKVTFKPFKVQGRIIADIYQVGLPSMVMQAITSVTTICLNAILIAINETGVAVLGVYFKVQSFVFMPVFGMNHGLMPIMGYNYGAKNRKRLIEAHRSGTIIAVTIMTCGMLLFKLIPTQLMALFNAQGDMMTMGVDALTIISWCFPVAAISIIMGTLFQATAHGVNSLVVSVMRQLVAIVPAAWLLSKTMGVAGVWWAYPIAEAVSLTVSSAFCIALYRKDISKL